MKLWIRIFLSILAISLTTLFLSSNYLISTNHLSNINREQDRSLAEFEYIRSSFLNSIDIATSTDASLSLLAERYGVFYSTRNINLMLYRNYKPIYINTNLDEGLYQKLLAVQNNEKMVQIFETNKQHIILVSGKLSEDNSILIYSRDITLVYKTRNQSIKLSIILALVFIIVLSILSYLYSRWITKPIEKLQKGASAIAKGDYNIRLPENKDEFRTLSYAFNKMASAVQIRTTELQEKAKELQVFIDDLSHEMNTPLTSIQGYAEFLQSANATEEQREKAANTIRSEAKRMKDIYTKLMTLTFTREHSLERTMAYPKELVSELYDTFYPLLKERNITFQSEISIDRLFVDHTLIQIYLSNLIKNSIQAISNNGIIIIQISEVNQHNIITVIDNGGGIPKEHIDEIIKPFYRVDKSRSRKTGGAGLGLSICKSIADLHHAEMKINSQMGHGTSIELYLPA